MNTSFQWLIKSSYFTIAIIVFILSCQPVGKQVIPVFEEDENESSLSIIGLEDAKNGYLLQSRNNRKASNSFDIGIPDWNNAINRGTYVDVPLKNIHKNAFFVGENIDSKEIKKKIRDKTISGIRMMTISKTEDNKFHAYITEYIPDESFRGSFEITKFNSESDIVKNKFCGTIIRRSSGGDFLNGTVFKEGKTVKKLFESPSVNNGRLYNQICTYNYQINYWEYSDGSIEIISVQLISSLCVDVPEGGGNGGDSGGGGSSAPSSSPVPRSSQSVVNARSLLGCTTYNDALIYANPSQQKMAEANIVRQENGYLIDSNGKQIIARTDYHNGEYRILLSQVAFDLGEVYLASILNHELTHVKHIHEQNSDYLNDFSDWKNKSEYSALNSQINFLYPYVRDRRNAELEREYKILSSALSRLGNQHPNVKTSGYPSNPCH